MLPQLLTIFLLGLSSTAHCLVMCGGIATALSGAMQNDAQQGSQSSATKLVAFHCGRISCYAMLGFVLGAVALSVSHLAVSLDTHSSAFHYAAAIIRLLTAVLLLVTAAYVAGINAWIKHFEALFTPVWNKVAPYTKNLMGMQTKVQAFKLGFLWGFLPCGMIYSALLWSLSQHANLNAALLMLFFGLGTLPGFLAAHLAQQQWLAWLRSSNTKKILAALIVLLALLSAYPAIDTLLFDDPHAGHSHH